MLCSYHDLIYFREMDRQPTFGDGAHVGFWVWLGFIATTYFSAVIWQKMHPKEFFIHVGYSLIALLLMGGVLAVWH